VIWSGTQPRSSGHGGRANPTPLTAMLYCGPPTLLYADRRMPHCRSGITNLKRILVATLSAFLLSPGGAAAETFAERLLRSDMQTHPDWSVLIMDAKVLEEGNAPKLR
jgi:hypothetical protein